MAGVAPNAHPASETTTPVILKLPNELLDRITECADTFDLLNLRLAGNARLSQSALDTTQKRITTIYIEHSLKSLERFREICASPTHARQIKEVRYVACLRTMSRDDLVRTEGTPHVLLQTEDFREAIEEEKISNNVKEEVLAVYQKEKAEEAALLEQDKLCATLCDCLILLPNLTTLLWCIFPGVLGLMQYDEGRWTWQRPSRAYNRLSRWKYHFDKSFCEDLEHFPRDEFPRDRLLYAAQFKVPGAVGNMEPVMRATAELAKWCPTKRIRLAIVGPLNVLDAQWEEFTARNLHIVDSALHIVTSIDVIGERRWLSRWGRHSLDVDLAFVSRWDRLLSRMIRIKNLRIGGVTEGIFAFLKNIIERTTFPELEVLVLDRNTHWRHDESVIGHEHNSYSTRALGEFILRHRRTLKSVRLRCASGDKYTSNRAATAEFGALLGLMKSSLPCLQSAELLGVLDVSYPEDAEPRWSEGTPYGDLTPVERDRAREKESDIGRLARSCGIVPRETAVGSGRSCDEGETTATEGGRYGYGTLNRAFVYGYDFAPYVLGDFARAAN